MSDWRRVGTAVLVTALWSLTALAAPPEHISGRMTCPDAELIALVKKAEERRLTPQAVEKFVGRKATMNTDREGVAFVRFIKHYEGDGERRRPMGDEEPPLRRARLGPGRCTEGLLLYHLLAVSRWPPPHGELLLLTTSSPPVPRSGQCCGRR